MGYVPCLRRKEGTQLWKGVRLGKLLGAGAQVRTHLWAAGCGRCGAPCCCARFRCMARYPPWGPGVYMCMCHCFVCCRCCKPTCSLWPGRRLAACIASCCWLTESAHCRLCFARRQAKVFRVARDDGSPTGKVIKINHADMASKMLNNNVVRLSLMLQLCCSCAAGVLQLCVRKCVGDAVQQCGEALTCGTLLAAWSDLSCWWAWQIERGASAPSCCRLSCMALYLIPPFCRRSGWAWTGSGRLAPSCAPRCSSPTAACQAS